MMEKEYIERDKIGLTDFAIAMCNGDYKEAFKMLLEKIETIPAADVRPVVRCRDCQYCIKKDDFEYWCNSFCSPARLVCHDDFCSHGRKKDERMCWL